MDRSSNFFWTGPFFKMDSCSFSRSSAILKDLNEWKSILRNHSTCCSKIKPTSSRSDLAGINFHLRLGTRHTSISVKRKLYTPVSNCGHKLEPLLLIWCKIGIVTWWWYFQRHYTLQREGDTSLPVLRGCMQQQQQYYGGGGSKSTKFPVLKGVTF